MGDDHSPCFGFKTIFYIVVKGENRLLQLSKHGITSPMLMTKTYRFVVI